MTAPGAHKRPKFRHLRRAAVWLAEMDRLDALVVLFIALLVLDAVILLVDVRVLYLLYQLLGGMP